MFKPYSTLQIVTILQHRIKEIQRDILDVENTPSGEVITGEAASNPNLFDNKALEYLSKSKIVSANGDLRKALEVCRTALTISRSSSSPSVTMGHVSKALNEMGSSKPTKIMPGLPPQAKFLLCALAALEKNMGAGKYFAKGDLFNLYSKMAPQAVCCPIYLHICGI
jgi:Cdc6-like AAA superfamily ATPase